MFLRKIYFIIKLSLSVRMKELIIEMKVTLKCEGFPFYSQTIESCFEQCHTEIMPSLEKVSVYFQFVMLK